MRNYEVTFIVDPVLSRDEVSTTANSYVDDLKKRDASIVNIDEMGLRELAYPINKRSTGYYYCVEFEADNGEMIPPIELAMRRDDRIIRFLTVKLDKYGVKYNADKRAGLIGRSRDKKVDEPAKNQAPKEAPARSTKPENVREMEEE